MSLPCLARAFMAHTQSITGDVTSHKKTEGPARMLYMPFLPFDEDP